MYFGPSNKQSDYSEEHTFSDWFETLLGSKLSIPNFSRCLSVPLARAILQHHVPCAHPALALLLLASQPAVSEPAPEAALPGPMRRMVAALRALGPPGAVTGNGELHSGPWCALLPLWGNPYIPARCPIMPQCQTVAPASSNSSQRPPTLRSLADLHKLLTDTTVSPLSDIACPAISAAAAAVHTSLAASLHRQVSSLLDTVNQLWIAVPDAWRSAVPHTSQADPDVSQQGIVHYLLSNLGWVTRDAKGKCTGTSVGLCAAAPSIRQLTSILRAPASQLRSQQRLNFVASAVTAGSWARIAPAPQRQDPPTTQPPEDPAAAAVRLAACMRRLWHLGWGNHHKDTFWRLVVNGVPGAGGHDICPSNPCPCGWQLSQTDRNTAQARQRQGASSLRLHAFWHCPVAQAVLAELLKAIPAGLGLHTAHVWLMSSPCPLLIVPAVWQVVCLAALSAMHHGRKVMWALHFNKCRVPHVGANASCVSHATRAAAADFWCRLQDFVSGGDRWSAAALLNPEHPFICSIPDPEQADAVRLHLNVPEQQVMQPSPSTSDLEDNID